MSHWYNLLFHPGFWCLVFVVFMAGGITFYAAASDNTHKPNQTDIHDIVGERLYQHRYRQHHTMDEHLFRPNESYQNTDERQPLLQSPIQPFSATSSSSSASTLRNTEMNKYNILPQSQYHTNFDSLSDKQYSNVELRSNLYNLNNNRNSGTKVLDILQSTNK